MDTLRMSVSLSNNLGAAICLSAIATIGGLTPSSAAPGYTYDLIWEGPSGGQQISGERFCPGAAINNHGDVVFRTSELLPSNVGQNERIRVYVAWGGNTPELIFDMTNNNPAPAPSASYCLGLPRLLGINDDGIVSVPLHWVEVDENGDISSAEDIGYGLVEPGGGLIRTMRGLSNSSARVNGSLQIAFNDGSAMIVSDGNDTSQVNWSQGGGINGLANINSDGTAAAGAIVSASGGTTFFQAIARMSPPYDQLDGLIIGESFGTGDNLGHTDYPTPGINDLGWLSFSTNSNNLYENANPRVMLISPAGEISVVAQAQGTDFANFRQAFGSASRGTGLNNFNRVTFLAQRDGEPSADAVYVGDASGDPPRVAVEPTVNFSNGRRLEVGAFANDWTDLGVNSFNDLGEIAFSTIGALYDAEGDFVPGSDVALFIARPLPGLEPGNPILPGPGDTLPGGGWRIVIPPPVRLTADSRIFVDPPIAVGYDFTMDPQSAATFGSVLVPVPLPGGDEEFTVEFNGTSAPLLAGRAFYFDSVNGDPVRQFRISGIDPAEELDPTDPTAFVTGLTFLGGEQVDTILTMVPVVGDTPEDDYEFVGFLSPIANPPAVNVVKARRVVPVKWSLITSTGAYVSDVATFKSLTSQSVSCDTGSPTGPVESIVKAGDPGLTYDASTNQFQVNWSTASNWRRTCRAMTLELADGQARTANFRFN